MKTILTVVFFLLFSLLYAFFIEPDLLIILNDVTIHSERLHSFFGKKTLVHLSDLHIDKVGYREKHLISVLLDLHPDLIVITGDISSWEAEDFSGFLEFISKINAPLGVFIVLGDADYSHRSRTCVLCHINRSSKKLRKRNFKVLRNETIKIHAEKKALFLCALDPYSQYEKESAKNKLVSDSPREIPMVTLDHMFRGFKYYKNKPDLILSGNTHGGQIYLPTAIKKHFMTKLGHKTNHISGLFLENKTALYVSQGIGTSEVAARFLCPPEVAIFHFAN